MICRNLALPGSIKRGVDAVRVYDEHVCTRDLQLIGQFISGVRRIRRS